MNKNRKNVLIIFIAILVVYNIIFFTLPSIKSSSFWVSYIFGMMAIILNLGIILIAWNKATTTKSKFMGVPILIVGYKYAITQLISSAIFLLSCIIPNVSENLKTFKMPYYIPLIINSIIFIVYLIFVIIVDAARDEINHVEDNIKEKVIYIKDLQLELEIVVEKYKNDKYKEALVSLIEQIRFSDPISDKSLSSLENEIKKKINRLKGIEDNELLLEINKIEELLAERNKRCKILK